MKKILITGATGLIGRELTRQCHREGIAVNYLTTRKDKIENSENYRGFYWDPTEAYIDRKAFEGVKAIVNLAGAPISKRWTETYKRKLLDSRIKSIQLIYDSLKDPDHTVEHFISASGVNFYSDSDTRLYTEENTDPNPTFLGELTRQWEGAALQLRDLGMEVSIVRTGMVLATDGGALPQLIRPVKLGLGAAMGSGRQWQSWIHLEDIAGIYLYILQNQLEGIYNGVAPNPVKNNRLVRQLAGQLRKPVWLPNTPGFGLRLILGEMATLVLEGQLVSSKKIQELGYDFRFYKLDAALSDLLS